MSKRGGSGGGRSKVACAKPADPPFIQKIKEKIGWKPEPTIESKHQQLSDDDDDPEFEQPNEEKPTIVVLKPGDLTAEEAEEAQKEADLNDRTPGRYKYRKPTRKADPTVNTLTTGKRPSSADTDGRETKREKVTPENEERNTKKDAQPAPSRNLLSFGDDEDD